MKSQSTKIKEMRNILRWVGIAALTVVAMATIFKFTTFQVIRLASLIVNQRSFGSNRSFMGSRESIIDRQLLGEQHRAVVAGPLLGKDIVLVGGSYENHPLNIHTTEIKANREYYAAFHGIDSQSLILMLEYDFMWANLSEYRINDAETGSSKISVLVDAFKQYPRAEWMWWLEFDAVIMTPTMELREHILNPNAMFSKVLKDQMFPPLRAGHRRKELIFPLRPDPNQINLLISYDQNGLNTRSFFLRRTYWTERFLKLWVNTILMMKMDRCVLEQDSLNHIFLRYHHFMKDHVGIVSPGVFNTNVLSNVDRESLHVDDVILKTFVMHFAGCR